MRMANRIFKRQLRIFRVWVRDNQWVHIITGLVGNGLFFIGSILFLWSSMQIVGVGLFIIGSLFMLVGSLGDAIVKYEERRKSRNNKAGS